LGGGSKGEYRKRTLPVGNFKPNPWGLYQVHGNVWELTQDCWNESNSGNPGDGNPRTGEDCTHRMVRGGSWYDFPRWLRAAFRMWYPSDFRNTDLGFRLGRTLAR
jgi:formylglycine-generating enzyme required for sulfatase activity